MCTDEEKARQKIAWTATNATFPATEAHTGPDFGPRPRLVSRPDHPASRVTEYWSRVSVRNRDRYSGHLAPNRVFPRPDLHLPVTCPSRISPVPRHVPTHVPDRYSDRKATRASSRPASYPRPACLVPIPLPAFPNIGLRYRLKLGPARDLPIFPVAKHPAILTDPHPSRPLVPTTRVLSHPIPVHTADQYHNRYYLVP